MSAQELAVPAIALYASLDVIMTICVIRERKGTKSYTTSISLS